MYLDANNLYLVMFQKLPMNGFKWKKNVSKFNEQFIKSYDEDSNKAYIYEVDVEYPEELHNLHINLLFLLERMKIKKCNKFACNFYDKICCSCKSSKTSIESWTNIKKVHRVIQFNQEVCLKTCIEMNTKLRTETKMILRKIA